MPFGAREAPGDNRISGSFASLAGIATEPDLAVQRILLGHALIAGFGGIPLIYMGDELAMPNDDGYLSGPAHAQDSRWSHRPQMDWAAAAVRETDPGPAGVVFRGVRHILARRRVTPALHAGVAQQVVDLGLRGVFAQLRRAPSGVLLGVYNLTEHWQNLAEAQVRGLGITAMHDALSDAPVLTHDGQIVLPPYARVWLT